MESQTTGSLCMEYRKRSRLVRAKGCSNLLCRDVPKVSNCPKSHPELLDVYLHCCCHGQDNQVYCPQNRLLVAHIYSILQVQNHSAVSLFMVVRDEGAKVSGEIAQGILTICGDYLLVCLKVGEVYCQEGKPLCFVGIGTVAIFLEDWWRLSHFFYGHSYRSSLWLEISDCLLCTGPRPR